MNSATASAGYGRGSLKFLARREERRAPSKRIDCAGAVPRTEVVKKLWVYIKKNGLQDSKNRRMINADDKLKVVFGGKGQVSMFDMTKLVSKHLS
jgi:hypothetical protein